MHKYAILCNPGHNRVYFEESKKLAASELKIALSRIEIKCSDVNIECIAGIYYITFASEDKLKDENIKILSRLSFSYALFEIIQQDKSLSFIPIEKNSLNYFNPDISSILKYTGKTNEIFTRMMINIALFSSDFYNEENIKLLDPIAGKGTTLFEGLICGYDVYGIEIGDKAVNETFHYIKKYLETEKYKHNTKIEKISGENKSFISTRYKIETAKSKEAFKQENFKTIELIAGNSVYANKYYKKNSFHIIVGDLPYGVQHGNVTNEKQSSLTRNPKELLMSCLPGWRVILIPGGTIVLAWNKFVLSKEEINSVFDQNGFTVLQNDDYNNFEHRVDQAIKRDIIVAKYIK